MNLQQSMDLLLETINIFCKLKNNNGDVSVIENLYVNGFNLFKQVSPDIMMNNYMDDLTDSINFDLLVGKVDDNTLEMYYSNLIEKVGHSK